MDFDVTDPDLVAPVGHYHGAEHGTSPTFHVRVDTRTRQLDEIEHAVWLLAHLRLLPPSAFEYVADNPAVVRRMFERELLTVVPADQQEFRVFAAAYRLVPVLFGLGAATDGPEWHVEVGPARGPAWVSIDFLGFEMWRRSAVYRSLSDLCVTLGSGSG